MTPAIHSLKNSQPETPLKMDGVGVDEISFRDSLF